ncbi:MAG: hypothetical protein IPL40_04270 [Proteobacteria bacterium]|nr:hypothetical protein [Pseudomonadota bacterium]
MGAGSLGDGTTINRLKPVRVTTLGTNATALAAGYEHSCARRSDGTVWCWGNNLYMEIGDGTTIRRLKPIRATALGTDTRTSWPAPLTAARGAPMEASGAGARPSAGWGRAGAGIRRTPGGRGVAGLGTQVAEVALASKIAPALDV